MNNHSNDKILMNGLFDAPKKLKGLSIAQVVGEDNDEEATIQKPDWIKNVKGTRLDPQRLALVASVFGYKLYQTPRNQLKSGYLLSVIPPKSLSVKRNNHNQLNRGILLPLELSISAQRASIAREFNLPSSGGLIIYLINEVQDVNDEKELVDEPGPLINEKSWKLLWKSFFHSPNFEERHPDRLPNDPESDQPNSTPPSLKVPTQHQSIAGKIEFDIDTSSKSGQWYKNWPSQTSQTSYNENEQRPFRLRSNTQEIVYSQDNSQLPTPAALSAAAKTKLDTTQQDSPRSTSSLPYRAFELETIQSLLQPGSKDQSSRNSPTSQSRAGSPSGVRNRGSVHVMQDTLDELEKALADLSPRPIEQNQDFGQRRDAVHKAARTLSKIGNREGFHLPRKDDGTLKTFDELTEEDENNFEQHGTAKNKSDLDNDLVGSVDGYRQDDEPIDVPKSPSRSTESRSNSLSNSSESNQNERLTETPATETDLSRYTPPPQTQTQTKPHLSITTNQNPQFNISPSSPTPIPKTAPAEASQMHVPSPPRSAIPKSPSIASVEERRSITKTPFSFGSRRKESIQIDRKNSTESKRSLSIKDSGSGLDGLGIRSLKFWSSKSNQNNNQQQRQREPSITMPVGVVKTASGGPGKLVNTGHSGNSPNALPSRADSMRSVSPTFSSNDNGNSATTSMIEHFPDSRYPKDVEMSDGRPEMIPLPPSVRQNSVESIHTHRTQSSTSTAGSLKGRGFMPRKQSLDYSTLPSALPSTGSHSTPLPSSATFALPEAIPENLEDTRRGSDADSEQRKIDEIISKEREKDFEAKVEAFEQEQLASQARAKALTQQEETRKAIKQEEQDLEPKKKGEPGSRFSASPPPSPPRKLPAVPVFSRKRRD